MKKMKYKLVNNGMIIEILENNLEDQIKITKALKITAKHEKIDIPLSSYQHDIRSCNFCGNDSLIHTSFKYDIDHENKIINIIGLSYLKDKPYGSIYYCHEKGCEGRNYNPNSVKFINIAFGIFDEIEALRILKLRNKSPFYKENYASQEEYINYQKHVDFDDEKLKIKSEKLSFSLSKEQMIDKHGKENYKMMCNKKDSSSLSYFEEKYGDLEGEIRYKDKCNKSIISDKNYIDLYGYQDGMDKFIKDRYKFTDGIEQFDNEESYIKYYIAQIERLSYAKKKSLNRERIKEHLGRSLEFLKFYNKDIDTENVVEIIYKRFDDEFCIDENYMYYKSGKYDSYNKITPKGTLRSSMEIYFYDIYIQMSLDENDLYMGKMYPNVRKFSDFYFKSIDRYVEIIGMASIASYRENIKYKLDNFNPILIEAKPIYISNFLVDYKNAECKNYYGEKYNAYFI